MTQQTPLGLTYPEAGDHTRIWEHMQQLADDTDAVFGRHSETVLKQFGGGYTPPTSQWTPVACAITKVNMGGDVLTAGASGVEVLVDSLLLVFGGVKYASAISTRLEIGPAGYAGGDDDQMIGDVQATAQTGTVFYQAAAGQLLQPFVYQRASANIARAYIGATVLRVL